MPFRKLYPLDCHACLTYSRPCCNAEESYTSTYVPSIETKALLHFYRAMAWLGEEIEEKADGALAPRCVKDVIEEKLFDGRRNTPLRPGGSCHQ